MISDLAEAQAALVHAVVRYPDLNASGVRSFEEGPLPDLLQVATAIEFLRPLRRVKVPNLNSYRLKHRAEAWGRRNGLSSYVANGALIVAAVYLGFVTRSTSAPNLVIGVGLGSLRKLRASRVGCEVAA